MTLMKQPPENPGRFSVLAATLVLNDTVTNRSVW